MSRIGFDTIITKSFDRTIAMLFKPFSLKKWIKLLFIAFLAGAITSSGGCGGGTSSTSRKSEAAMLDNSIFTEEHGTSSQQLENINLNLEIEDRGRISYIAEDQGEEVGSGKKVLSGIGIILIIPIALFVLLLIILFAWLGARFRFIWFNAIVNDTDEIGAPFNEYKNEGNSLFKFYMVLLPIVLVFFGIVAFTFFLPLKSMGVFDGNFEGSIFQLLGAIIVPLMIFIGGIILLMIFNTCIDHFIVTIMAMDRCSFAEGWRKFVLLFKQNVKGIILFLLLLIGLGIVAMILISMAAIVFVLTAFLIALIIFGIPYFLLVSLLSLEVVFLFFAIIVGIPFILLFTLITLSIGLPFAVFFRNLSLYFISSLDAGYVPLILEDAGGK